jgi:hypothetical protein
LYLINLSESANSVSKIDEAFYALSWAHKLAGVPAYKLFTTLFKNHFRPCQLQYLTILGPCHSDHASYNISIDVRAMPYTFM